MFARKIPEGWQMEGVSASLLAGLSSGTKSVKERVIAVLSSRWPLSPKQIIGETLALFEKTKVKA